MRVLPKFKINKKEENLIVCKISSKEEINYSDLAKLTDDISEHFINFKCIEKKKNKKFVYDRLKYDTLNDYLSCYSHSQSSFYEILFQICHVLRYCEDNGFSLKKLITDINNVYIDVMAKKVKFLYYPINCNESDDNLKELLAQISSNTNFTNENNAYEIKFKKYVEQCNCFSLIGFENFVDSIKPEENEDNNRKKVRITGGNSDFAYDPFSEFIPKTETKPPKENVCLQCGITIAENETYCEQCKSKKKRQTKIINKKSTSRNSILIRTGNNNEEIILNKKVFTLGRSENSDYTVDNEAVSFFHAEIHMIDKDYYIVDKKSSNGTYINDEEIPFETKVLLKDNYKVELADEIFIFKGLNE